MIDGDTLQVAGVNVSLEGIDAPERDQTCAYQGKLWLCGLLADGMLRTLIRDRDVSCELVGKGTFGRLLAVCHAGADNLSSQIVRLGFAMAFRRYSDRYVNEETAAKADQAGMWVGTFIAPWDWRLGGKIGRKANPSPGRTVEQRRRWPVRKTDLN